MTSSSGNNGCEDRPPDRLIGNDHRCSMISTGWPGRAFCVPSVITRSPSEQAGEHFDLAGPAATGLDLAPLHQAVFADHQDVLLAALRDRSPLPG